MIERLSRQWLSANDQELGDFTGWLKTYTAGETLRPDFIRGDLAFLASATLAHQHNSAGSRAPCTAQPCSSSPTGCGWWRKPGWTKRALRVASSMCNWWYSTQISSREVSSSDWPVIALR